MTRFIGILFILINIIKMDELKAQDSILSKIIKQDWLRMYRGSYHLVSDDFLNKFNDQMLPLLNQKTESKIDFDRVYFHYDEPFSGSINYLHENKEYRTYVSNSYLYYSGYQIFITFYWVSKSGKDFVKANDAKYDAIDFVLVDIDTTFIDKFPKVGDPLILIDYKCDTYFPVKIFHGITYEGRIFIDKDDSISNEDIKKELYELNIIWSESTELVRGLSKEERGYEIDNLQLLENEDFCLFYYENGHSHEDIFKFFFEGLSKKFKGIKGIYIIGYE